MPPKDKHSKKKPADRASSADSVSSFGSDWCIVQDPEEAIKTPKSTSSGSSSSSSLLKRAPKSKPPAAPSDTRQERNPKYEGIPSSKLHTNNETSGSFDNLHSILSDLHVMEPETLRKPDPYQSKAPTSKSNLSHEHSNTPQASNLPHQKDVAGFTKASREQNSFAQGSKGPRASSAAAEQGSLQARVTKSSSGSHHVSIPFDPTKSTRLQTAIEGITDEVRFARYNLACAVATFTDPNNGADPVLATEFIKNFMINFYTRNIQDYEAFAVDFTKRFEGSRPDELQLHELAEACIVQYNIRPSTSPSREDASYHEPWPALEEFAIHQASKLLDQNEKKAASKLSPAQEEAMGRVFKFVRRLGVEEAQVQKMTCEILKAQPSGFTKITG